MLPTLIPPCTLDPGGPCRDDELCRYLCPLGEAGVREYKGSSYIIPVPWQDKARVDSDYPPADKACATVDGIYMGARQGCYAIDSIHIGVGEGRNDHDA